MSNELKDCPFCGSKPVMKHIGNDHTKSRAVEVKCSNVECRIARTDKAFRHDHAWLTNVATEGWNRRPALATPPVASSALEDERAAFEADTLDLYPSAKFNRFPSGTYTESHIETQWGAWQRRAKLAAAAAPNAALVEALKQVFVNTKDKKIREYVRAALAQAGEVAK